MFHARGRGRPGLPRRGSCPPSMNCWAARFVPSSSKADDGVVQPLKQNVLFTHDAFLELLCPRSSGAGSEKLVPRLLQLQHVFQGCERGPGRSPGARKSTPVSRAASATRPVALLRGAHEQGIGGLAHVAEHFATPSGVGGFQGAPPGSAFSSMLMPARPRVAHGIDTIMSALPQMCSTMGPFDSPPTMRVSSRAATSCFQAPRAHQVAVPEVGSAMTVEVRAVFEGEVDRFDQLPWVVTSRAASPPLPGP